MESVHGRLWKSWLWRVQIQGRRLAFVFGELEIPCSFIGAMVVDTGIVLGKLPTAGEWQVNCGETQFCGHRQERPYPTPCLYDEAPPH